MGMRKRNSGRASPRRFSLRMLIGLVALGLPAAISRPASAFTPESALEQHRESLHARVARVRAALEGELETPVEEKTLRRLAQWYNWGNWGNGWDNNWNNWPNRWSNY